MVTAGHLMYPIEARTALGAAFIRAAHVELSQKPYVFNDFFAGALLAPEEQAEFREGFSKQYNNWKTKKWFRELGNAALEDSLLGYLQTSPLVPEILARQAYAESYITGPSESPFHQYLILGAGLDTFSLRNSNLNLMVYEIDRRIVTDFKKKRLASAGLEEEARYCSVPVDFEREQLAAKLKESGFRSDVPSVVSWLGVTPYLTLDAIESSLHALNSVLSQSSLIVFDYTLPKAIDSSEGCPFTIELAERLLEVGEPLLLNLQPEEYIDLLTKTGFRLVEHLFPKEIQCRYFADRADGLHSADFVCLAAAEKI